MKSRRYPVFGKNPKHFPLMDKVDYVEFALFNGPNLGYFCSTCDAFQPTSEKRNGQCMMLDRAAVKTYGCCNAWQLAHDDDMILANGEG